MSRTSSESSFSDDSEYNFIPGVFNFPLDYEECDEDSRNEAISSEFDVPVGPYQDEPLADPEWLKVYKEKKQREDDLQKQLEERLAGIDASSWCSCGHCKVGLLQNAFEAKCCKEIDQCCEALERSDVLEETGKPAQCVVLHPGFRPVCLEKWSLKQSASKYKTREKIRYTQTGKESTFLRAVAYREFCQLVYGFLGSERIPLPACVYHAIRTMFGDDAFTGFEDPEAQ